MSQLIASQKVIQGYLDALLTEDDDRAEVAVSAVAEKQRAELNTLLAQAVTAKPVAATAAAVSAVFAAIASCWLFASSTVALASAADFFAASAACSATAGLSCAKLGDCSNIAMQRAISANLKVLRAIAKTVIG